MKTYKRIAAAGMSVLVLAGMSTPALAAGGLEKDETVYVVMEADGSVRSQTVSAHLHSPDGLEGVTDKSSLTGIENTQDSSAFTQNGEEISWDTDGKDIYYKGESSRKAPISASIKYELDGKEAAIDELLGQSGRLRITVRLQNNESGTADINGQSRKVVTPFITMVGAMLGDGWENVEAPHGIVKSVGAKQAAGFVCMPGVRECLKDLLPEDMDGMEELLRDEVVLEADVTDLAAPSIFIVCGADAQELKEDGLSGVQGLEGLDIGNLQEDMDALDDGMAQLLDGAGQLTDGAKALNSGALELAAGVAQLVSGAAKLNLGAYSLRDGAQALSTGASNASTGASALQGGADELYAGVSRLQDGTGALTGGYAQLKSGSESLVSGLSTLTGSSGALNAGMKQVSDGIAALYAATSPEGQLAAGAGAFGTALDSAAAQGLAAVEQLPAPEVYGQLLAAAGLPEEQSAQLLAAYTGAYQSAQAMAGGLSELDANYAALAAGIAQVSEGVAALQAGVNSENGLAAGLSAYTQGAASAYAGAQQLDGGLDQLGGQLPALTGGVAQLADGSNRLSAGARELSEGNAALAAGAQRLADGSVELCEGTGSLVDGVSALAAGAEALKSGAQELSDGASQLDDGLERYNREGISKLTGSLDADELSSLKATLEELEERKEAYGSFAGAPEDAEVSTRFILKTAETANPVDAGSEEESGDAPSESLWDRIKGLFS